ncbi:MAG: hypothetical protein LBG96_14580 [Tannerella sp.]|nr:hypothetical protein [Tannerella sp.]
MGLFNLFNKETTQGNDQKHFNYVFIVRRKAGKLPCDTEHGWDGIMKMCQNVAKFKKAKIVHPRDWDNEPYEDPLFGLNCGLLDKYIKAPDAGVNINFSDLLACENSMSKRSDNKEELKFSCYNLLASGISKYIITPNMNILLRNAAFDASVKFANRKGLFVLRFEDAKLEVADGKNLNRDICEGIAFVHVTGKRPG